MGKKKGGGVRIKQVGPKGPSAQNLQAALNPLEALTDPTSAGGIDPRDIVNLPPPPDRSYQIYWPITETFSMKTDNFQIIYPSYLDGSKTVMKGRRISKEMAVDPSPTVSDVSLALQSLQVRHVLQPYRGYSRDVTTLHDNPGRVLVDVSNHKKLDLLKEIAAIIPNLPERIDRLKREQDEREKEEEERKAYFEQQKKDSGGGGGSGGGSTKAITSGPSSSSKKGKKGKKK